MSTEDHFWDVVEDIRKTDGRYSPEAYGFVMDALEFTMHKIGERRHVSGAELLTHLCEHAKERFGMLAHSVLTSWGLASAEDVGEAVFRLVEAQVLSRRESDSIDDFRGVMDLRAELEDGYFPSS